MKDIGGYFELDIPEISEIYHKEALAINFARYGLTYVINNYNIKELWVPYYTCTEVWKALEKTHCKIKFYNTDKNLLPTQDFSPNDFILYTNYFGICAQNIRNLCKKYKNVIVDNAQAFYMPHCGFADIYSCRKFFGVPDGGYVYCNNSKNIKLEQDKNSYKRFSHLLMRVEGGSNFGYSMFNQTENSFDSFDIKLMSELTTKLLKSFDYEKIKNNRLSNFKYLSDNLDEYNMFKFNITEEDVPMYYPFLTENKDLRKDLISNHIYLQECWRDIESKCSPNMYEMYLKKNLYLLIIDQRYNLDDMKKQVNIIKKHLNTGYI